MVKKRSQIYGDEIDNKIIEYYKDYYKTTLGLPNWDFLSKQRLNEEEIYCSRYINRIKQWIDVDFKGLRVLVVGSGTGGELVNFHNEGAEVYGIEPYSQAMDICKLKAEVAGISNKSLKICSAEDIDFEDSFFDFVYCFTVIEHVEDVNKSISEMIRVTKQKGYIFIQAPDYRQLYEGHYKLPLPMFLPNFINKVILKILRRPTGFLNTLNKVTSVSIRKILENYDVISLKVHEKQDKRDSSKVSTKLIFFIQDLIYQLFDAPFNQVWLIRKK